MTLENYAYRTNPMFLRNQFPKEGKYGIPMLPAVRFESSILSDLRFIAFNQVARDRGEHPDRVVHFFLYDYEFEKLWKDPDGFVNRLKPYRAALTPDFSMYLEMPAAMQLYNTFRNRWCGAYLAQKGLTVIPTVNWGNENSFDFCFDGIPKGSMVAVSTYMASAHGNRSDQKDYFLRGYEEMLRRIEPDCILCYHKPFPEMQGNIVTVSYESSSWQSLRNDKKVDTATASGIMISKAGFVQSWWEQKGSGSAHGGSWRPSPDKPQDARFLGEPGETKSTHISTRKGGYDVETKIDQDGRAVMERHFTDHGSPNAHSIPHDHEVDWSLGYPRLGRQINYSDEVPAFKMSKGEKRMSEGFDPSMFDQYQYESLGDFKFNMECGSEIEFTWNDRIFAIFSAISETSDSPVRKMITEIYVDNMDETEMWCDTTDEVLDYMIEGKTLRERFNNHEILITSRTV